MTKKNNTIYSELEQQYGPFMGGKDLRKALGFQTYDAFRQAQLRGVLPVKTFKLEHRQGQFALTSDVVKWIENTIRKAKGGQADD